MHEQQFNEAIRTIRELIRNTDWSIDDSDIMDGNIYITICKPLDEEDRDWDNTLMDGLEDE